MRMLTRLYDMECGLGVAIDYGYGGQRLRHAASVSRHRWAGGRRDVNLELRGQIAGKRALRAWLVRRLQLRRFVVERRYWRGL